MTVLNGHIRQIQQKVEGNVAFYTARSTAYPIPVAGTGPAPGPDASVIEADALLSIAGPFRDARVGAVAGKVAAYNRDRGFVARYLRWDRGHIREEIRFFRIVCRRPPMPRAFAVADKVIANLSLVVGWAAIAMLAVMAASNPMVLVRVLLVIGIGAASSMLYYLYTERSMRVVHAILYAYFAFFTLWWVFPYAIVTVRSRSCMTR